MNQFKQKYIIIEFILLFIAFPISLCFPFNIWIKLAMGIIGFAYMLRTLLKTRYPFFKHGFKPFTNKYAGQVVLNFCGLVLLSITYLYSMYPEKLFYVLITKPKLWLLILFVYSFLSVLPQELIYRSFYFERYSSLFKNKTLLIVVNAIVFSMGHLFFQNTLVLGLTFVGGLIFGYSYFKTKSFLLVSIEHTLYGCWLFTVGMGDMLGFPSN